MKKILSIFVFLISLGTCQGFEWAVLHSNKTYSIKAGDILPKNRENIVFPIPQVLSFEVTNVTTLSKREDAIIKRIDTLLSGTPYNATTCSVAFLEEESLMTANDALARKLERASRLKNIITSESGTDVFKNKGTNIALRSAIILNEEVFFFRDKSEK